MATDPYAAYLFSLKVGSSERGGFNEISGLAFESEVETLKVGGMSPSDVQLLGPSKTTRLVLKRGLADASYFWTWYLQVTQGEVIRRAVTVTLRQPSGDTMYAWTFREACPVKWTGPSLQAGTSAVAFESIELVHRGLQPPSGQGTAAPAARSR